VSQTVSFDVISISPSLSILDPSTLASSQTASTSLSSVGQPVSASVRPQLSPSRAASTVSASETSLVCTNSSSAVCGVVVVAPAESVDSGLGSWIIISASVGVALCVLCCVSVLLLVLLLLLRRNHEKALCSSDDDGESKSQEKGKTHSLSPPVPVTWRLSAGAASLAQASSTARAADTPQVAAVAASRLGLLLRASSSRVAPCQVSGTSTSAAASSALLSRDGLHPAADGGMHADDSASPVADIWHQFASPTTCSWRADNRDRRMTAAGRGPAALQNAPSVRYLAPTVALAASADASTSLHFPVHDSAESSADPTRVALHSSQKQHVVQQTGGSSEVPELPATSNTNCSSRQSAATVAPDLTDESPRLHVTPSGKHLDERAAGSNLAVDFTVAGGAIVIGRLEPAAVVALSATGASATSSHSDNAPTQQQQKNDSTPPKRAPGYLRATALSQTRRQAVAVQQQERLAESAAAAAEAEAAQQRPRRVIVVPSAQQRMLALRRQQEQKQADRLAADFRYATTDTGTGGGGADHLSGTGSADDDLAGEHPSRVCDDKAGTASALEHDMYGGTAATAASAAVAVREHARYGGLDRPSQFPPPLRRALSLPHSQHAPALLQPSSAAYAWPHSQSPSSSSTSLLQPASSRRYPRYLPALSQPAILSTPVLTDVMHARYALRDHSYRGGAGGVGQGVDTFAASGTRSEFSTRGGSYYGVGHETLSPAPQQQVHSHWGRHVQTLPLTNAIDVSDTQWQPYPHYSGLNSSNFSSKIDSLYSPASGGDVAHDALFLGLGVSERRSAAAGHGLGADSTRDLRQATHGPGQHYSSPFRSASSGVLQSPRAVIRLQ
jgi:hypothetical protein